MLPNFLSRRLYHLALPSAYKFQVLVDIILVYYVILKMDLIFFFLSGYPVIPIPFTKESILSPLNWDNVLAYDKFLFVSESIISVFDSIPLVCLFMCQYQIVWVILTSHYFLMSRRANPTSSFSVFLALLEKKITNLDSHHIDIFPKGKETT